MPKETVTGTTWCGDYYQFTVVCRNTTNHPCTGEPLQPRIFRPKTLASDEISSQNTSLSTMRQALRTLTRFCNFLLPLTPRFFLYQQPLMGLSSCLDILSPFSYQCTGKQIFKLQQKNESNISTRTHGWQMTKKGKLSPRILKRESSYLDPSILK